jgi:SNF2 family DNA or RNA helicase
MQRSELKESRFLIMSDRIKDLIEFIETALHIPSSGSVYQKSILERWAELKEKILTLLKDYNTLDIEVSRQEKVIDNYQTLINQIKLIANDEYIYKSPESKVAAIASFLEDFHLPKEVN